METTRWIAVRFASTAMIHRAAAMRLKTAPIRMSTIRSGRSRNPTVQDGMRLSARARAYEVMKLPKAATQTSTMNPVRCRRAYNSKSPR